MANASSSSSSHGLLQGSTVQAELQTALRQLVILQPEDPVIFLKRHFESLAQGSREPSVECVELLRDAETVDPAQLDSALYGTFALLQDNTTNVNGSVLFGRVPGNSLNDLLRELCANLPPLIADTLLRKLQVSSEASLSFVEFTNTLTPRFKLQSYLRMARQVFELIDVQGADSLEVFQLQSLHAHAFTRRCIGRGIGEELLSRLRACVTTPSIVISPAEVTTIIQRVGQSERTITRTEFESAAGQLFVEHLPSPSSTHSCTS